MNLKTLQDFLKQIAPKNLTRVAIATIGIITFETIYLLSKYQYINDHVPFWYNMPWGTQQLSAKASLFLIPATAAFITIIGLSLAEFAKAKYFRYGTEMLQWVVLVVNILLASSLMRIVRISSSRFKSLFDADVLNILAPMALAFVVVYLIAPKVIALISSRGVVTNPEIHTHPGMVLKKPSARGGGLVFFLGVLITALIILKPSPTVNTLFLSAFLCSLIGIFDDIQNTRQNSKLKFLENPILRFGLQALAVIPIFLAGIRINFVNNPFDGTLVLNQNLLTFGNISIAPLAIIVTIFWLLWFMNVLSWSNGVDGQYGGIIGIAALVIALITLRLVPTDPDKLNMVKLSAIIAGAAFGMVPFTWHPSKLMWGFGAITAGMFLGSLSIITESKIAAATVALAVPFLDGMITITRRVLQKKSPFKGDGGHLHHLLLQRGWSVRKVALFYWSTTALFGLIGILAADKDLVLTVLMVSGGVAFFIILLNLQPQLLRVLKRQVEK